MLGFADSSSPIFPATCGDAKLVPDLVTVLPFTSKPSTHCPKSEKSTSPCHVLKYALFPSACNAATVIGLSKHVGYLFNTSSPSFPAAQTSGTPAATQESTAFRMYSASVSSDMFTIIRLPVTATCAVTSFSADMMSDG